MKINRLITLLCAAAMMQASGAAAQDTLRLTQADCRRLALTHSEKIEQADNAVRQAELDRQVAKASFLPTLDGTAMGIYSAPDMDLGENVKLQMRGTYMAGINLVQPLYTGGKLLAGKRLAEIGRATAAEQQRMTRMDVGVEADNAYWTYIAVRQKVRMMQAYRVQLDTLYHQTRVAVDAGMATENDLLRIEARRTDIHYQLQKVENGADLCRLSLCRVIGADFATAILPTDTLLTLRAPEVLSADIAARPELNLLQQQIAANAQQIKLARADLLPTVALHLLQLVEVKVYSILANSKNYAEYTKRAGVPTDDRPSYLR